MRGHSQIIKKLTFAPIKTNNRLDCHEAKASRNDNTKENKMYKFSAPMPYEKENIDRLLDINNQVEKSKIASLFFSLPSTCELFTGFEQYRNSVLDEPIITFIHHLANNQQLRHLSVKDYKKYLPNINYFKKHGELCAVDCGVNCRYCYKCAGKIQKVFEKKI